MQSRIRESDTLARLGGDEFGILLDGCDPQRGQVIAAEILAAVRSLASDAAAGMLDPAAIDADLFTTRLSTSGIPDPDLLVRTSGEWRVSNFLLWQIAYSELWITSVLWPDFNRTDLLRAVVDYQKRDRRFGGRS